MEKAIDAEVFGRSVEKNQMRYTTFISDGHSSAHNAVKSLEPYGADHPIGKQECVNPVA